MTETVNVFLWPEKPVGKLWFRSSNGRESASFEYDPAWLASPSEKQTNRDTDNPDHFALEPALKLGAGTFHTHNLAIFGSLGDSAPDRWGRILMRRKEERLAKTGGRTPHTLTELDFLLGINDEARQGALRFKNQNNSSFLAPPEKNAIPPLVSLPKLLSASERFLESRESDDDLRLLLAPGSSLGGARPKVSVYDAENLSIAKFPRKDDEIRITLWEAHALMLAKNAGITVPVWRIVNVLKKPVLVLKRFDRQGQRRIPFLSAMSMLGARDNEQHSYIEIAHAIIQYGAEPLLDLEELWRRLVFNICISNIDDHLRNHGFLYTLSKGWRLSPVYDLNPVPRQARQHFLSLAINKFSREASVENAFSVINEFRITRKKAAEILDNVQNAVKDWKKEARLLGINRSETEIMASAFLMP